MKKIINKYLIISGLVLASMGFQACSLDEFNHTQTTTDLAYTERYGFEAMINATYIDIYYMYGKIDGMIPTEAGTDLWTTNASANTQPGMFFYNNQLDNTLGTFQTLWRSYYSIIDHCNTAIYYADLVTGYDTQEDLNAKVAEVYLLRAFANFHLVEQWGGVTLRTIPSIEEEVDYYPTRSSEEDFYELIFSDLEFACKWLPEIQSIRGRVAKKAAYGLLAKAYLQRTRLGEAEKYAKLALDTAEYIIEHQDELNTALVQGNANASGFARLWTSEFNKTNTENLWCEAVEYTSTTYLYNPEGANRGRTWQFFLPAFGNFTDWGLVEASLRYGRANNRSFRPTKYLLTEIFDPRENTPDSRYDGSFHYKYYTNSAVEITTEKISSWGKDPSLEGTIIPSSVGSVEAVWGPQNMQGAVNTENDEAMGVFVPNWTIPAAEKARAPYYVIDPSDMFDADDKWVLETRIGDMYPALKKYSDPLYIYSNQYWMGDFPIIRLAEIYLIAAEAALRYNNDEAKALGYVNVIRERAAFPGREAEMRISSLGANPLEYVLQERGRELAGEHMRWYDLKRYGHLNAEWLGARNPYTTAITAKNYVRPIPRDFLSGILNADEYGTNGY